MVSETDESADSNTTDDVKADTEDDSPPMPGPMADELASDGYRRTQSECKEDDCGGLLWYSENMLVCDRCSTSIDLEARRSNSYGEDPWERYRDDPPRYRNSGRVRMPGGFLSAYDWVEADEADRPVAKLDADEFYG